MIPLETFPAHLNAISSENWQKLFQYLPELHDSGEYGDWRQQVSALRGGAVYLPAVLPSKTVTDTLHALYDLELIISFDWGAWTEGSRRLTQEPFMAEDLDAVTICKMITGIVRSDRFNEGSLMRSFQDGRMTALLKALEQKVNAHPVRANAARRPGM